jgi:hypothetical protein
MPDTEREARALRRLLRSFRPPSSYGLVLVMIIGSYVVAVTLPAQWGQALLLSFRSPRSGWRSTRPGHDEVFGSSPLGSSS